MALHGLQADPKDLMGRLPAELLGRELQHLLGGAVDLDLGGADDGDGDALAGVDPGTVDLQSHRVQGDPLDRLDAGEHQGPPSGDEGRLPALYKNISYFIANTTWGANIWTST